jgi:excisionase family DNA binding protein
MAHLIHPERLWKHLRKTLWLFAVHCGELHFIAACCDSPFSSIARRIHAIRVPLGISCGVQRIHPNARCSNFFLLRASPKVRRGDAMEKNVLTIKEAATELQVSVATLRLWIREGRGPNYFRAGKLIRYRRADLESWMKESVVRAEGAKDGV